MNRHAPAPLVEIVYRRGRMAVFVGFLLALALFAALAYLRLGFELSGSNRSKIEIVLALVGLVLVVFLCHLHNAFLKRGATIHAAPEGLTLMASSTPVGPIPWREIRRIGPFRSTKHVLWFDKIGIELAGSRSRAEAVRTRREPVQEPLGRGRGPSQTVLDALRHIRQQGVAGAGSHAPALRMTMPSQPDV